MTDYVSPGVYACKICGRILDSRTDQNNEIIEFNHTGATTEKDAPDHEPDPVPLAELDLPNFMCDFCLADHARWYLPVRDHPVGMDVEGNVHMDEGGWAACDTCAVALRYHNWDLLTMRSMRGNAKIGRIESWWFWKTAMDDLRQWVNGDVRLYLKGDVK